MPTHLLLKGSTLWVLNGHYDPPETGFSHLTSTGAVTIEISDFLLSSPVLERIAATRLGLIIQAYPLQPEDLAAPLALAKQTKARAINLHVRLPHISHEEAADLVCALIARAADADVALYFETHRGCITQDLYRTARLVEAIPEMRLTLDVSHYVLAGEQVGPTPAIRELLEPMLDRVEMIHGRISNGQQIQVPVVDPASELAGLYRDLWTETMRRWRRRKPAGSTLIFTPELGPPPYAVTTPEGGEVSNRLEQTEVIWSIAQQAWKASAR
jgi:sugar phosphate isomerase/epimerase